jgi:lipid-binding SYLF domain-containing protein
LRPLFFKKAIPMLMSRLRALSLSLMLGASGPLFLVAQAKADEAQQAALISQADKALSHLIHANPIAGPMTRRAKAMLIFPKMASQIDGLALGEGELRQGGAHAGFYRAQAASKLEDTTPYGFVVFLMTDKAVRNLHKPKPWKIGTGPSVLLLEPGMSTSEMRADAYVFVIDDDGLRSEVAIGGMTFTKIKP